MDTLGFILSAMLIGCLILLGIAFAYGDFIEYMGIRIEEKEPEVCIFEAQDTKIKFHERDILNATFYAIKEWQDKLNAYTNSTDYDLNILYYLNSTHFDKKRVDYPDCNVFIAFEYQNMIEGERSNSLALVGYDYSRSWHKYSNMLIFTDSKLVSIKVQFNLGENFTQSKPLVINSTSYPYPNKQIELMVKHEFGHIIGIGHHNITLDNHFPSIMGPNLLSDTTNYYISDYDLEAVVQYYGDGGFRTYYNLPRPDNYTP